MYIKIYITEKISRKRPCIIESEKTEETSYVLRTIVYFAG